MVLAKGLCLSGHDVAITKRKLRLIRVPIGEENSSHNFREMLAENPHVRFFDSRQRGYVAVDVTADRMETRLQVISDRRDPKATLSTLQRFVVASGKPGAIAV